MNRRTLSRSMVGIASVLVLAGAAPAYAASMTKTKTAPYAAESSGSQCLVQDGAYCLNSAQASRADGDISVDASVRTPAFSLGYGFANANGQLSTTAKSPSSTRSVTVTATIRVSAAEAQVISLDSNSRNQASIRAIVRADVACGACPGGVAFAFAEVYLVDTDPATEVPPSLGETVLRVPVTVQIPSGFKAGTINGSVQSIAFGQLTSSFDGVRQPIDQVARANGSFTVTSFEFKTV